MATYPIDDKHNVTVRPADRIAPGTYRCTAHVGLTDGSLTLSSFVGEGNTPNQAEYAARSQATAAVAAEQIKYRSPALPAD